MRMTFIVLFDFINLVRMTFVVLFDFINLVDVCCAI